MNLNAMLKRIEEATVPLDASRVGDRSYLADREVRCCKAMLAVVEMVPPLVVTRDALREELARLSHRAVRKPTGAATRAEIDAKRAQVEVAIQAGAQAVTKLRSSIAEIGRLQRTGLNKRDQRRQGNATRWGSGR